MSQIKRTDSILSGRFFGTFPKSGSAKYSAPPGLRLHLHLNGDAEVYSDRSGLLTALSSGTATLMFNPEPETFGVSVQTQRNYRAISLFLPMTELPDDADLGELAERPFVRKMDQYMRGLGEAYDRRNTSGSLRQALTARARELDLISYCLPDKASQRGRPKDTEIVFETMRLLRDTATPFPSTAELCEALGVSSWTLRKAFSNVQGAQYADIVSRMRFERACNLLRDQRVHIAHVAFSLGYTSAANFATAFKRQTGTTPREWRARWR